MPDNTPTREYMAIYSIYGLVDPRTDQIFYVGVTSLEPDKRLGLHLSSARKGTDTLKDRYVREMLAAGLRPSLRVLAEALYSREARDLEDEYIHALSNLTNIIGKRHVKSRNVIFG